MFGPEAPAAKDQFVQEISQGHTPPSFWKPKNASSIDDGLRSLDTSQDEDWHSSARFKSPPGAQKRAKYLPFEPLFKIVGHCYARFCCPGAASILPRFPKQEFGFSALEVPNKHLRHSWLLHELWSIFLVSHKDVDPIKGLLQGP